MNGWIGVDLDGTLASYDKWRGETHIGSPIVPMLDRVKRWLKEGRNVKIFTARISAREHEEREAVRSAIEAWCMTHIGCILEITCTKDYAMIELWDDRAIAVNQNTGEILGGKSRVDVS